MTLGELMPSFGKFYCKETCGIDGSALYANRVYPIAVDKERNRIRITVDDVFLFSDFKELEKYGRIEA